MSSPARLLRKAALLPRLAPALLLWLTVSPLAAAQSLPEATLQNRDGLLAPLSDIDQAFVQSRLEKLDLARCREHALEALPRTDFRHLESPRPDGSLRLYVQPDVMRSGVVVIVQQTPDGLVEYTHCDTLALAPVLALMATTEIPEESMSNRTQQAVLADNSFLTSHQPSYLMLRNDDLDSSASYMDFTLSAKHPVLPNAHALNSFHTAMTNTLEQVLPGDNEFFMQLYMSFTGRFSQYIGTRESAPVVARSFNPTLFYRFWTSSENYLDFEYGHESNGQRINSPEALEREEIDYLIAGEPAAYARDALSRGWDYTALHWRRAWNDKWATRVELRHYLNDGLLQGRPEEYNIWEDGGSRLRPRRQYDGVRFSFEYNFNRSRCFLGSSPVCFQRVSLTQDTGYSAMFEHNTTTLELTSDFFGLPVQFWAKTGYNTNLVDYYRHVTSWGMGIQLLSR
jgi:hypothetical protein